MRNTLFVLATTSLFILSCGKLSEEELWKRVESAKKNNNVDSTIVMSQKIIQEYPKGKFAPASLFLLAETYYRVKKESRIGLNYYKLFVERYPDLQPTPVAQFLIGFIYNNDLRMIDSARFAYESFLTEYPDHQLAESARFELSMLGKPPEEIVPHPTPRIFIPNADERKK